MGKHRGTVTTECRSEINENLQHDFLHLSAAILKRPCVAIVYDFKKEKSCAITRIPTALPSYVLYA
jgi:hypothetical protein